MHSVRPPVWAFNPVVSEFVAPDVTSSGDIGHELTPRFPRERGAVLEAGTRGCGFGVLHLAELGGPRAPWQHPLLRGGAAAPSAVLSTFGCNQLAPGVPWCSFCNPVLGGAVPSSQEVPRVLSVSSHSPGSLGALAKDRIKLKQFRSYLPNCG